MMTIKEILNQAILEAGFTPQNTYATSTLQEAQQALALANRELNRLQKDTWQELKKTHVVTMASGVISYDLPTDYRQFIPDTAWSADQERRADFPVSDEVWSYLQARDVATGLTYRVRLADNKIQIHNPSDGSELPIEYISDYAVISDSGEPKRRFTADSDQFLLNDDLLILGVKWRFNKVKGLDWQADFSEYQSMYARERGTNNNAQTISFAGAEQYPPFPPQTDLYLNP